MKIIYYPNPLRTRVYLNDLEKENFRLRYKVEYLHDIISGVRYRLKEDPNKKLECPNPNMNGLTHWELARKQIPENFYTDEFDEHITEMANYYLNDLENGYHCGDCTCVPCSCSKCHAEYLLGIDTIKGLGKHEAHKIDALFNPVRMSTFDTRTIDEVLELLKNYHIEKTKPESWSNFQQEYYESHIPRWNREAENAYKWLLNYKHEHGF